MLAIKSMKLWIITACLNESSQIKNHLSYLNYLNQTHGIKYIIADGGSTDETVYFIKEMLLPDCLLIENGGGIYRSWNKAISKVRPYATNLVFLGVNDIITDGYIKGIKYNYSFDLIISGLIIGSKKYQIQLKKDVIHSLSSPISRMPVHHAGTVFNCRLFDEIGLFSENYRISSDLDWMLKLKNINNLQIIDIADYGIYMKDFGASSGFNNALILLREELFIAYNNKLIPYPKRIIFLLYSVFLNLVNSFFNLSR